MRSLAGPCHGAGKAGEGRVYKDEIGFVEQGVLVGHELEGRAGGGVGAVG